MDAVPELHTSSVQKMDKKLQEVEDPFDDAPQNGARSAGPWKVFVIRRVRIAGPRVLHDFSTPAPRGCFTGKRTGTPDGAPGRSLSRVVAIARWAEAGRLGSGERRQGGHHDQECHDHKLDLI
jgi:hypothetical protein